MKNFVNVMQNTSNSKDQYGIISVNNAYVIPILNFNLFLTHIENYSIESTFYEVGKIIYRYKVKL